MTRASVQQRRLGFTLMELLLALALAAGLAVSLYSSFSTATRARRSALAAVEPMRNVSIAADIIARDFANATTASGVFAGRFIGLHETGELGDADGVQFHTIGADEPLTDNPLAEGIRRVEYIVRSDVTPPVLVRRVQRNLNPSSEPIIEEEIICRDVRSFSLRYFDGLTWGQTWDSTQYDDVVPAAVAMTLELNDPQAQAAAPGQVQISSRRITRIFPLACSRPEELIEQVTSQQ